MGRPPEGIRRYKVFLVHFSGICTHADSNFISVFHMRIYIQYPRAYRVSSKRFGWFIMVGHECHQGNLGSSFCRICNKNTGVSIPYLAPLGACGSSNCCFCNSCWCPVENGNLWYSSNQLSHASGCGFLVCWCFSSSGVDQYNLGRYVCIGTKGFKETGRLLKYQSYGVCNAGNGRSHRRFRSSWRELHCCSSRNHWCSFPNV